MDKKDTCAITYFGDDGSSDGVVAKGQAYGVRSIRDGNEALDIYSAIQASRQMAITESKFLHIEWDTTAHQMTLPSIVQQMRLNGGD
ncbi:hypothetical protein JHK82_039471 [Glycine max]|nr:hypothetical protein JHK86_039653 [Glycine max]KAG4965254.1 hypothetical protein JHK85_040229 [Glycine max]KAG5110248.1 hypothetical protein JHK82_039471 [Glycine max]KAG5121536.1 hypothetical protein JHK84_039876 [Glycine max]